MDKFILWTSVTVVAAIFSYIPVLFGGSIFGLASILLGLLGSFVGIYVGVKLNQSLEL
jgi:hypothetical protein